MYHRWTRDPNKEACRMARERLYREWRPTELLPATITPAEARDVIIECFHTVHGPHFEQTKAALGIGVDHHRVRRSAKGVIRLAFKSVQGNYDEPTRDELLKVIHALTEQSRSWGTPDVVIERHANQLRRVVSRVKEN